MSLGRRAKAHIENINEAPKFFKGYFMIYYNQSVFYYIDASLYHISARNVPGTMENYGSFRRFIRIKI